MTIPKTFYRVTKHKKPRFQFYQPGFNAANSCWLDGDWVTVTTEQWAKREEHQILYAPIHRDLPKQHYRDAGTPLDKMTRAQKQAWEFNSGLASFEGTQNGHIQGFRVNMAGGQPKKADLAWMRKNGYKILRKVKQPNGEVTDQIAAYDIPVDLIDESLGEKGEPIDFWAKVVDQNRERSKDMFKGMLSMATGEAEMPPLPGSIMGRDFQSFMSHMAVHGLIELEEEIIRDEWNKSVGRADRYSRLEEAKREYAEMRADLQAKLPNFEEAYSSNRETHNHCARTNLDNSKGHLFDYVLPKFNPDGTHEPWGERDVPWNRVTDG